MAAAPTTAEDSLPAGPSGPWYHHAYNAHGNKQIVDRVVIASGGLLWDVDALWDGDDVWDAGDAGDEWDAPEWDTDEDGAVWDSPAMAWDAFC